MILNFTDGKHDITDEWGRAFAEKFLDYIRARLVKIQEETGHMYNLEATPAESATYRFAREDKKRFVGIIQAGTSENPYYTNSSQLPVGFTDDPFEALELQADLQSKYTGGTVLHLYMGQRVSSAKVCRDIVKRVLTNYRLPYITITPTFPFAPSTVTFPESTNTAPSATKRRWQKKKSRSLIRSCININIMIQLNLEKRNDSCKYQ